MARSRAGGTSALLSGKLGDVIYQITRNPDGSFRQSVMDNPESRINPNTDAQARARLTMALIERAMFTYRDFMGTGFEGVDPGTNSVSKFSEVNYNIVKYDIDTYWDVEEWPDWNYDFPKKGVSAVKDGCYTISQGTLRDNLNFWPYGTYGERREFGFNTRVLEQAPTVKHFLDANGLRPGMQYVAIFFCQGTTPSKSFIAWLMIWTEESVRLNDNLTSSNWRKYIKTNSNVYANTYFLTDTGQLVMKCDQLDTYHISRTGCFGHRLRVRENGKYRYNTCEMMWNVFPTPQEAWGWKTLWEVKPTWIE